jgi:hypothetical protein
MKEGSTMNYRSGAVWSSADILFLKDQLGRGMTVEQLAGFLNKPLEEIRMKARELTRRKYKSVADEAEGQIDTKQN